MTPAGSGGQLPEPGPGDRIPIWRELPGTDLAPDGFALTGAAPGGWSCLKGWISYWGPTLAAGIALVGACANPLEMSCCGAQRPAGQMPRKMQSTREKEQAKHWRLRPRKIRESWRQGLLAPMFWSSRGNRAVAAIIRKALVVNGFASGKAGGVVQPVNALRGACSAPGVLWGKYRHETGNSKITEAHPTALLYLLHR